LIFVLLPGNILALDRELRTYRLFLLGVCLAVAVSFAVIFAGVAVRTRSLLYNSVLSQARADFRGIVLTRKWNARYGGVFVRKTEGVDSNPFMKDTDITASDGRVYTLRNPAMMTREISLYARREGLFSFHLTSLRLTNPANAPDAFEREALAAFEKGVGEVYRTEAKGGRRYFRYMAPLYVESECMKCHEEQGFRLGDVRGGISVSFDINDMEGQLRRNVFVIAALAVVSTLVLAGVIYLFASRFMKRLAEARKRIETLAMTDGLTGLHNRRHGMSRFGEEFARARRSRGALGCILVDVDKFKQVNDTHGHLVGDEVLRNVSRLISESVRAYDIACRYGGEEFLVVMPGAGPEEARGFADRLRKTLGEGLATTGGASPVRVTVSMGVAGMAAEDESSDSMLKRADEALYRAKSLGRDRVVVA
jgi:diguanylate cyclase (GGDEF)-like protein